MEKEEKYYTVPEKDLPKGRSFRRVYGNRQPTPDKKKFGEAPNQLKIIPLVE